jgi:hypothetical protein
MNSFGFILTRHVNSEKTNRYWNHSVQLLRRLYPNKQIIIIDDNSNEDFVKADFNYNNTTIIQSEFPGRGEILPYYYFLKNKYFENAVILHDSVFFHKRVRFELLNGEKVVPLWYFNPDKENNARLLEITDSLKNSLDIYNKLSINDNYLGMPHLKWAGCFGCQSYINHDFLLQLENKYSISNLVNIVQNRADRCCLERVMGCLFFTENPNLMKRKSLLGNIMTYQKWSGYSYEKYILNLKKGIIPKPVVKVWTGR